MTAFCQADQKLIVRCPDPFNAETRPEALIATFLTPQAQFYIRSHGPAPLLPDDHRIEIGGMVDRPASYSAAELQAGFIVRTVVATMQCAGNRREHLQEVAKTSGDPWDVGAIGNAEWTGASLADVLVASGIREGAAFVGMTSADEVDVDGDTARSIPLAKACDPDVLIAWAMNGEPLTPEHGAPLRLVVPGFAGVRSPKWLTHIEVRDRPSDAPIQAKDYKLFPASVAKEEADWSSGMTIDAMPLNSAICSPLHGATIGPGPTTIRGYATASDRRVCRVEISANDGADWVEAELTQQLDHRWSWTQWEAEIVLRPGEHTLVVRAIDETGQMQIERPGTIWNFAGYLSTAWHRIVVKAA